MAIGLIVNWALALYALLYSDSEDMVEIDLAHLIITIPVWPLTLWQIIQSLTEKDDDNGN